MNILIVGASHGDELLGPRLYRRMLTKRLPLLEHIDFIIGNPRAYAAKKRYIDCDLNRSYNSNGPLYEQQRAVIIKQHIQATKPDLVVDMHTTTCEQPSCLIVANLDGRYKKQLLRASSIRDILQVTSLDDIATVAVDVVGYEVPNSKIDTTLLDEIIADLERCVASDSSHPSKTLYKMKDKIYKRDVSDEQASSFVNFEMHELGFVPIMTGNNSYRQQTDYLGFKSAAPVEVEV